jgi:hypothetical protein
MYSYPFQFQIPDWLPASMILCPGHEQTKLSIRYYFKAKFTPQNHDVKAEFYCKTPIFVFRPTVIYQPNKNFTFHLENKIGGFLGFGTSNSSS